MKYDVDHDYPFEYPDGEDGLPLVPDGMTKDDDGLYVLPNGRYLPSAAYQRRNGARLIYEPRQLSPWTEMLAQCTEE